MAEPPGPAPARPRWAPGEVLTAVFLFDPAHERVVLLQRAPWKAFAPDRWTGIGGKVDGAAGETAEAGAWRELGEETGLTRPDLTGWRHVATVDDPRHGVTLAYFTATLRREALPACTEGTLHWVPPAELDALDIIDNTRLFLTALLAGVPGAAPAHGHVVRDEQGRATAIVWATG